MTIMYYALLLTLWATLTFQIFLDENSDGQHQVEEPGLAGQPYTVTWLDGNTSSVALGATSADGYLTTTGAGTLTLETACTTYTAQADAVSGQSVIPLPCPPHFLYLAVLWR